jgi:hypothetical protein
MIDRAREFILHFETRHSRATGYRSSALAKGDCHGSGIVRDAMFKKR